MRQRLTDWILKRKNKLYVVYKECTLNIKNIDGLKVKNKKVCTMQTLSKPTYYVYVLNKGASEHEAKADGTEGSIHKIHNGPWRLFNFSLSN